ncbi:hypothetical protein ACFYVL_20630 [Streptomyces sp. NPDC004111]|uniref:hypothetical protein n=1 Tax=Streptomyces sp. NPDC004111 TaxID=3364690 RepID=UPI0036BE5EB3
MRARWVRGGLGLLSLLSLVLGGYVLISPEGFFGWSWVGMGMAYNPHLMLDVGAMNLAVAVPLGAAAVTLHPVLVRSALGAYAVWSIAHFLIHLRFRSHLAAHTSLADANLLLGLLGLGVAVPLVLLLLTFGGRGERKTS